MCQAGGSSDAPFHIDIVLTNKVPIVSRSRLRSGTLGETPHLSSKKGHAQRPIRFRASNRWLYCSAYSRQWLRAFSRPCSTARTVGCFTERWEYPGEYLQRSYYDRARPLYPGLSSEVRDRVQSHSPSRSCSPFLHLSRALLWDVCTPNVSSRIMPRPNLDSARLAAASGAAHIRLWIYEHFSDFVDDNIYAISNLCVTRTGQSAGASFITNHAASSIDKSQLRVAIIRSLGLFSPAEQYPRRQLYIDLNAENCKYKGKKIVPKTDTL